MASSQDETRDDIATTGPWRHWIPACAGMTVPCKA